MPITTLKEQNFPKWCELQYYEIIKLNSNDSQVFERREKREKIIICSGDARLTFLDNGVQSMNVSGKANVDISDDVKMLGKKIGKVSGTEIIGQNIAVFNIYLIMSKFKVAAILNGSGDLPRQFLTCK